MNFVTWIAPVLTNRIHYAFANAAAIIGSFQNECQWQFLAYQGAHIIKTQRIAPGTH